MSAHREAPVAQETAIGEISADSHGGMQADGAAQWLPIETLPRCGKVQGFMDDRPFIVKNCAGYVGGATVVNDEGDAFYETAEGQALICTNVTHWMPLPSAVAPSAAPQRREDDDHRA